MNRSEMKAYLIEHPCYYRDFSSCSPLAWNVKIRGGDLSFNNLVSVYQRKKGLTPIDAALRVYQTFGEYTLCEWALESMRAHVNYSYSCLDDGTELNVGYVFEGRSGGWLLMETFEGCNLLNCPPSDFRHYLNDLDYKTITNLYKLTLQNDKRLTPKNLINELECRAALILFNRVPKEQQNLF